MTDARNQLFRRLPQLGEFLDADEGRALLARHPRPVVIQALRRAIEELRTSIARGSVTDHDLESHLAQLPRHVANLLEHDLDSALRPVINATGVILQTNLGRAPLSARAVKAVADVAAGYSNLEFDLASGHRGKRGAHVERLLLQALDLDASRTAALVVNNCAAATLLALNTLADDGEVIVSRGELVEIGGGFRVPEILRKSGARLVEVGTTNRTRIEDYAAALTPQTKLLLRVHRSNFEIVGFTEEASLPALVELGAKSGVPVFFDQGTGCMIAPAEYGLGVQSTVREAVSSGASLVSASGDKLLGGPQCGLLVGDVELINRLRRNPLYRALRVDKMTIAALQETLIAYLAGDLDTIPTVRMISTTPQAIEQRCRTMADAFLQSGLNAAVISTESVVGGGTTPGAALPSFAVAIHSTTPNADELASGLRRLSPPVIGRIQQDRLLLDLRTVPEASDEALVRAVLECLGSERPQKHED